MQIISTTYYCDIIVTKTNKQGNLSKACLLYTWKIAILETFPTF